MPKYLAVYATACLTRGQLEDLVRKIRERGDVACEKAYAGFVSGVLVCLFDAPDRDTLDAFQKEVGLVAEHVWKLDLEMRDGQLERI